MSRVACLVAGLSCVALAAATPAGADTVATPQPSTSAVVLVSGVESSSPFVAPDPACTGQTLAPWFIDNGVGPALQAQGYNVFAAPVRNGPRHQPPATCATGPAPPKDAVIDSKGRIDANGAALNRFLSFLASSYGITQVQLVAHSDGGLWSRGAIATHTGGPTIASLVTLGTLHNGSFMADVGTPVADLPCKTSGPTVGKTCKRIQAFARAALAVMGPDATNELTSTFMTGWNARRTTGPCRVTVFEGTAIDPAAPPAPQQPLPEYYAPNDELVGLSSAAGQAGKTLDGTTIPAPTIPGLVDGGSFPVYHAPSFGISEMNDPPLNAAIATALQQPSQPCAGKLSKSRSTTATLPLRAASTTGKGGGRLSDSKQGDIVYTGEKVAISCGSHALVAAPLMPPIEPAIQTYVPGPCKKLKAAGPALLLHGTGSKATVTVSGKKLSIAVAGKPVGNLTAEVRKAGRWTPVTLTKGSGTVDRGATLDLRLAATTRAGEPVNAAGLLSR